MRGHHAFLSSLTPFQRQIWPRCKSTPRARGMELITAPMGAHPPAGDMPGCWDSGRARGGPIRARLSGVRLSGTTEGAPGKRVPLEAGPGQAAPVPGPPRRFPVPCARPSANPALLRPARGAKPSRAGTTGGKGSPHHTSPSCISQGCIWHHPGVYESSLLEKLQECSFLLDFPHPSEQALFMHSLGFLGNEQPPAESPTPPVLCYCSCQVLNVALVVVVTTESRFALN